MSEHASEGMRRKEDEPGGNPDKTEQAILSKLLFDEGEFLSRLEETIERAMKFFRLEPRSGRVVLTDDSKRRKVQDQIRLLLAGRYFAWKLNLVSADKMNYREIAVDLNRPPGGISPELTTLVHDGVLVRDEEGLVSMPFHNIDGTLREFEQSATTVTDGESPSAQPTRRQGSRRTTRQRVDPTMQSMLEKTVDLSEYSWVKNLKKAQDKGLAALHIAKEKYGVGEMTCPQMETFLTRMFPMKVTRAAINMAFLAVKSEYVTTSAKGKEISYSLLPPGKEHLLKVAEEASRIAQEDESDDTKGTK